MGKIGNVVGQHLEINRDANVGDLGDSVSFLNNIWSSINNFHSGSNLETVTSILLAFQDGVSVIAKSRALEVANGSGQLLQISARFTRNVIKLLNELDVNQNSSGYVNKATVIDVISDFNAFFGIATSLVRLSPVGVVLNIISIAFTSISNHMNTVGANEKIHKDDILNFIGRSTLDVVSKWSEIIDPITSTLLSFMPDDLNPWSGITIDLVGTKIGDNIYGDEDRKYNIWGHDGNDTLTGGRFNDYIDGGSFGDNDDDHLYGGEGNNTLRGSGRLEGGNGIDIYKAFRDVVVKDEDGKGKLEYESQWLRGARDSYYSESLTLTKALDFSKSGYLINDTNQGRATVIAEGANFKTYQVRGNIDFKFKGLSTEDLSDTDLGIAFFVMVYNNDEPPPPPPFLPPHNLPTRSDPLILDLNHDGQINTVDYCVRTIRSHLSEGNANFNRICKAKVVRSLFCYLK